MKTKISVADVVRIGGCQTGLDRAIALGARVGIPADAEVEYDTVLQTCKDHGDDFLFRYFTINKPLLLAYSEAHFKCYLVGGVEYESLEAAQNAANEMKAQREAYHIGLTSAAFTQSIGEDHSWLSIDLNTFEVPNGVIEYHFHVFNHRNGTHEEAATLDDAKQKRDDLVRSFLADEQSAWQITMRSVYEEDGVSIKDEVLP